MNKALSIKKFFTKYPLILVSKSERRKQLLKKLNFNFKVYHPKVRERITEKNPLRYVTNLALTKALQGYKKFKNGIVIGADTIVVLNNEIITKPKNKKDAIEMLKKLSGTKHKVYTAIALINCLSGKIIVDYDESEVKMKTLSDEEIAKVAGKHLDKAGAYAIQDKNDKFVTSIKGDYYNVVGFPIRKFLKMLKIVTQ